MFFVYFFKNYKTYLLNWYYLQQVAVRWQSNKTFHENVAGVPGQLQACLAYTGRAYEQSMLVCAIYKLLSCKLPSTLYNVQITKYTVQCTNYQVHRTMYKLPNTLYNVQITKYTVQCTNYQVHCTIYNVQVHVKIAKKCFYRVLSIYNIRLRRQSYIQGNPQDEILMT